jgi:hypothetical protein
MHHNLRTNLPVSAGRNALVWRTRRADLIVADICGNVGKEKGRARGIEQATAEWHSNDNEERILWQYQDDSRKT